MKQRHGTRFPYLVYSKTLTAPAFFIKGNHGVFLHSSAVSYVLQDLSIFSCQPAMRLSPHQQKFFMEKFGVNYLTYLTQMRLNHAVHDLINSGKNMEEISSDSGFPNSHAFTQIFKKEYGMLPSAYRRKQKQASAKTLVPLEQHNYMRTPSKESVSEATLMVYFRRHIFRILTEKPDLSITRIIRQQQEDPGIYNNSQAS